MPHSIIFYVSPAPALAPQDQPLIKLQHNIRENFRYEALPRWSLEHRMFRETSASPSSGSGPVPNSSLGSQNTPPGSQASAVSSAATSTLGAGIKYLQCLTLSWYPRKTWIGSVASSTNGRVESGTMVSMSSTADMESQSQNMGSSISSSLEAAVSVSGTSNEVALHVIPTSSLEDFSSLLSLRLSPLWMPRGGILSLRDGTAIKVMDFTIRYGELVSGSGATSAVRGIVCEIMYTGDAVPESAIVGVIQGVWAIVGQGIAAVRVFDSGTRVAEGKRSEEEVKRWMEVLRIRDGR